MSPEEEALDKTVRILERRGIPYMLTGSLATSYHGRPRTTHDADIVIDPQCVEAIVGNKRQSKARRFRPRM